MERWIREDIYRIRRENINPVTGRPELDPYGLAIRLQQELGLAWEQATRLAGYKDSPSQIYTPKTEPIRYTPAPAYLAEQERQRHERLLLYMERLRKDPIDRIYELMDAMRAREQLLAVRDNLLEGLGEVDQDLVISSDSSSGPHLGVLMLRVPCKTRLFLDALRTTKDYDDFASVRVGVYLPFLSNDGPSYYPDDDLEKVGVQIRESNLQLYSSMSPDASVRPQQLWCSWGNDIPSCFVGIYNNYPQYPDPNRLNHLLMDKIKETPIAHLTKPLLPPYQQPKEQDKPWYKRFFS